MIGQYVIVRCEVSGVFIGILKKRNGREVLLSSYQRLRNWNEGDDCIVQTVIDGIRLFGDNGIFMSLNETLLLDVIEIIPVIMAEKPSEYLS